MFKLKNITKKYNNEIALDDISLTIDKGMNFIIGASGSGKTTLLKIISGIEKDFSGEVYYEDKNIKDLNEKEKGYFYNNIFGFVWQDYNLLEELTVAENILLPMYLKKDSNIDLAKTIIKELKLNNLEDKKVKNLSGGQKQRVAIARELMKMPEVILADEPTSALDKKTSQGIMKILRKISEDKTVIIVTHDTSYIEKNDKVYELDKGELVSKCEETSKQEQNIKIEKNKSIPFKNIKEVLKINFMRHKGRFATLVITLMLAISLLLTTVNGSVDNTNQEAFDKLYSDYGESILDISLYRSFISASGAAGSTDDKPNANVEQNINGLYEKYNSDERVEFATYLVPFNNIEINVDGKQYAIQSSGNTPSINKIITGRMANGKEKEVVVPETFVKKMGITPEEAINKVINFNGAVTKWENNSPQFINTETTAKIVGVMDTTISFEYEGKIYKTPIEDSFLFSESALSDLLSKANMKMNNINFLIRAKAPKYTIEIKDELNKQGIVPLGRFELIEDLVNLNEQSAKQASLGNSIIIILSIIMVVSIFLVTGIMRKREYTIFKISGFSNSDLRIINIFEMLIQLIITILMTIILSPILNTIAINIFNIKILTLTTIGVAILIGLGLMTIGYIITEIICDTTNIARILKTGEKE